MKQVHLLELLEGSSVYDDVEGMEIHQTKVLKSASIVHYSYDGNTFIDVWNCNNGMITVDPDIEPTNRFIKGDTQFNIIKALLTNS